ncbi:MAG TPA: FtsQ-type POTRA domain-containing protein [Candidatus Nosocomiicoccus stercorigallinarum]|nr:FtsQ-type POTRA domain-containing protein [Candidatus Nosocomiicoccus stercorigallinarum]
MKDDFNIDELKKKLKKDRKESLTKETTKSEEEKVPTLTTEKEVLDLIKKESSEKNNDSLDETLIENYRDEEKDALNIEYDSDEDENKVDEKENKNKFKEKLKSIKKPKVKLPNINYLKLFLIILLLAVISVLSVYLISSWSAVKEIEVNGNVNLEKEEILERSGIKEGNKMYLLQTNKAEENIKVLPIVEKINVEREWPNKVVIDVEEYEIVGFVESHRNYYPVLENKRVLRGFHMAPENAPIIHFFEGKEFDGLVDSLNDVNPEILRTISEIYYRPHDESYKRIQVLMNNGQEIIADYTTFGKKINYFEGMSNAIGDKSGVIDLEVSNAFIPYSTDEARRVKRDMSRIPKHAPYLEEIDENLESIKKALDNID